VDDGNFWQGKMQCDTMRDHLFLRVAAALKEPEGLAAQTVAH
jgi:hypothetical protein